MKYSILVPVLVCGMCMAPLFSQENNVQQNVFLNNQKVELTLTPQTELGQEAVKTWTSKESPRLTTEKLFRIKKSDYEGELSIEKISGIIRSVSTMKGQKYYSNRHKKVETLYHDACLIDSPENKKRIEDQTEGNADGLTLYCMQDDNSFGKCYYRLDYRQRENEVSVTFDNFEPLKFGPITAAKKHNVKINLVAVDSEDEILVYLLCQAYYPRISILEEKMIDSFNARVDAIYEWFTKQF